MLVVEDEGLVALLLEDMLDDLGCVVVGPVARLDQAIALARKEALELAILDINIAGGESYPVADALAARNIPYIFATGYDLTTVRERYRGAGILQKPFRRADLQTAIHTRATARRA